MMNTEPAAVSVSDKIATYFVVPVIPGEGSTESVLYYEEVSPEQLWQKVDANKLNARGQNRNAGMIKLTQPSPEIITKRSGLPAGILDTTVTLYAGVARTLGVGEELGGAYSVGAAGALIIPVLADTKRALILVFTQKAGTGKEPTAVTRLIGSTDPEIKNSVGG
jgi:hypothetical protein